MKNNYYTRTQEIKSQSMISKLIITLLLSLSVFASQTLLSQNINYEWSKGMGGTSLDEGSSITYDATGNVYITGRFYGTVDFNPGSGTNNLTSNGFSDIYVLKLDGLGNFIWAKSIGGIGQDKGNSIYVDPTGNVFVTGYFSDTVDFDPGTGTSNIGSSGEKDIFVLQLSTAGNLIWAKKIGGNGIDEGYDIQVDDKRFIYLTGYFSNTVDFDPGTGVTNSTSNGLYDAFVLKLKPWGDLEWVETVGGNDSEFSFALDIDTSGNIITTGYFSSTVDFNPGTGTNNITSNGMRDCFVLKLSNSGGYIWAKHIGGGAQDVGKDIVTNVAGEIFVTGYFQYLVDFDPGTGTTNHTSNGILDAFVLKLNQNGDYTWSKQYGGNNLENSESISLDNNGNIYTTGNFYGTADFDPGTSTVNLTATGSSSDVFVLKLDATGNYVWAGSMGGISDDIGNSITVDNSCNIYSTGYFFDSVDFNPGTGTDFLVSNGSADLYIQKLSCSQTIGLQENFTENDLTIFPNPTSSRIFISNEDKEITNITIIDVTGKVIKSFKPITNQVDLSEFNNGIYFIRIEEDELYTLKKIIKN